MRIVYTSDIHIDSTERNREAARALARVAAGHRPDIVVVAGDAGNTIAALDETLSCFDSIEAVKFFVPGNHDVWIETEGRGLIDSRAKYAERIPAACRANGFQDLGQEPVVVGDVGFVGSLGWYDYTFADARLGLTAGDYWKGRYGDEIWWDKKMTYWVPTSRFGSGEAPRSRKSPDRSTARETSGERMRDTEVSAEMAERLEMHLASIEARAKAIVAVIHTLPCFVGIPRSELPRYLDAFTGSDRLGRVLQAHPKVRYCIHGHKHTNGDWTVAGIHVCRRVLGRVEDGENVEEAAARAVGVIDLR